jgi:hypothetical protein
MARCVGGTHAFKDWFVIVREEGLQLDVIRNLEIDPIVNVKRLVQKRKVEKRNDQK